MPINYEAAKTLIKGLVQKMKSFRGNWEQNDPTADDYIKNRPFYTEIKESEVYALPRKNYGFEVGDYAAAYLEDNGNDIFTTGKTYMVEIDGALSELKCKSVRTKNGPIWKYFGSPCLLFMPFSNIDRVTAAAGLLEEFGVEDSGENFCIMSSPDEGMFGIGFEDISITTHSVAVYSIEDIESIHKIDNKYLPDMNYISYNGNQNLTYRQQNAALSNIGDAFYDGVTQIANGHYVNYSKQQWLYDSEKEFARNNIDAISENDVYSNGRTYYYEWNRTPSYNGHDFAMRGNYFYYKIADLPGTTINYGILDCNVTMSDGTTYTNWMAGTNCYVLGGDSMCAIIVKNPGEIITHSIGNTRYGGTVESSGIYGLSRNSLHVSELSITFKIPKSGIRVNDANGTENTITVEPDGCISDSCISETIARKTDILSPDLSQTDETAADYVKGVIRQESLPEGYPYKTETDTLINPYNVGATTNSVGEVYYIMKNNINYKPAPKRLYVPLNGKEYDGVLAFEYYISASRRDQIYMAFGNLSLLTDEVITGIVKGSEIYEFERTDTGDDFAVMISVFGGDRGSIILVSKTENFDICELYGRDIAVETISEMLVPTTVPRTSIASPGQTIVVKAVDDTGKPTEWEAQTLPEGVPAYTSDDEGKFLRIVNGVPTWVAVPNAEEAEF